MRRGKPNPLTLRFTVEISEQPHTTFVAEGLATSTLASLEETCTTLQVHDTSTILYTSYHLSSNDPDFHLLNFKSETNFNTLPQFPVATSGQGYFISHIDDLATFYVQQNDLDIG